MDMRGFQRLKTQRHKGHREKGSYPQGSVLSVTLCFKKTSLGIVERIGSIPNLRFEDG
jgi:hypothetical protein